MFLRCENNDFHFVESEFGIARFDCKYFESTKYQHTNELSEAYLHRKRGAIFGETNIMSGNNRLVRKYHTIYLFSLSAQNQTHFFRRGFFLRLSNSLIFSIVWQANTRFICIYSLSFTFGLIRRRKRTELCKKSKQTKFNMKICQSGNFDAFFQKLMWSDRDTAAWFFCFVCVLVRHNGLCNRGKLSPVQSLGTFWSWTPITWHTHTHVDIWSPFKIPFYCWNRLTLK